eukprot:gene8530-biopygen8654
MLQLRASMESDATSHGGAEALRAKLAFIEEKVYAGSHGLDGRRAAERAPRTGLASGCRVKVYWPQDDAWYTGTVGGTESGGLTHIDYCDGGQEDLDMSQERYEVVLPAVQEGATLGDKTVGNYRPKAQAFVTFCEAEGRQWLPATEATVRLYIAHVLDKGTVQASNMQPYLSAIKNYHEDMGFPRAGRRYGAAKGRAVSWAVKGMSRLQVQAAEAAGEEQTGVAYVVFAFVTFGRPETGVSMRREHISITDGDVFVGLRREKGRGHVRLRRRLTISAAGVAGLVRLMQRWQQVRDACWGRRPVTDSEMQGSYWRLEHVPGLGPLVPEYAPLLATCFRSLAAYSPSLLADYRFFCLASSPGSWLQQYLTFKEMLR